MKKRIWELDMLRGVCVIGMVIVHLIYDLNSLYRVIDLPQSSPFFLVQRWGGVLFLLISGICVTLGSHPIRRGLIVFCGGILCSAVTAGMYFLHYADKSLIIYFGVLHCLGACMLLWPLLKKLPTWALAAVGITLAAGGLYVSSHVRVSFPYLIPLGLFPSSFASSDYFPLLPNLGYFLIGAFVGRTLYKDKVSLFPRVRPENPVVRFFSWWGKWSLPIYLLHQPLLSGILYLLFR